MKKYFSRKAIQVAMERPSPDRIPLSGYDRLRRRNYTTSNLEAAGGTPSFLVQKVLPNGFEGLWFAGRGSHSEERVIPFENALEYDLLITYYFHELELEYRSGFKFLLHKLLRIPHVLLARERCSRWLFNRKPLTPSGSIKVLRAMLDETLENGEYRCGPTEVMTKIYGWRWVQHPELRKMSNYYELLLKALDQSGDLSCNKGRYHINPQALAKIERFDQEDEKFRQTNATQRGLFYFTVGLVVVGISQAIAMYLALWVTK